MLPTTLFFLLTLALLSGCLAESLYSVLGGEFCFLNGKGGRAKSGGFHVDVLRVFLRSGSNMLMKMCRSEKGRFRR